MKGFFEQFMDNLMSGQKEKIETLALASIQHYSDEILKLISSLPPEDIIFYIAAHKTVSKVLEEAFPKESQLASGLTRTISTEALVESCTKDGLREITRIKSGPKR